MASTDSMERYELTFVAKPSTEHLDVIERVQSILEKWLSGVFSIRKRTEVHGTLIGLSTLPDDRTVSRSFRKYHSDDFTTRIDYAEFLSSLELLFPMKVQFGGHAKSCFLTPGRRRSLLLVGEPVREGQFRAWREAVEASSGVAFKYRDADIPNVMNEFHMVIAAVDADEIASSEDSPLKLKSAIAEIQQVLEDIDFSFEIQLKDSFFVKYPTSIPPTLDDSLENVYFFCAADHPDPSELARATTADVEKMNLLKIEFW